MDSGTEKIYIGQGKFVEDDPAKYPDKTVWTGGWAGGEAGALASCAAPRHVRLRLAADTVLITAHAQDGLHISCLACFSMLECLLLSRTSTLQLQTTYSAAVPG